MAIDPNIIFRQQLPNMGQSVLSGINTARQIRRGPLLEALQQQQYAMGQQQLAAAQQTQEMQQTKFNQGQAVQKAQYGNALAKQMMSMSQAEREAVLNSQSDTLRTLGVDPARLDITDQGLQSIIQSTQPIIGPEQAEPTLKVGPEDTVITQSGRVIYSGAGKKFDSTQKRGIINDVTSLTKETQSIASAAKSLDKLKSSSSAASKLAAVFKFMKVLDPTSVVKETEQGQVYQAQGAARVLAGKINALLGKGELGAEGFEDIVSTAQLMANSSIDSTAEQLSGYLESFGEDIPEDFKSSLNKRLPPKFKEKVKLIEVDF